MRKTILLLMVVLLCSSLTFAYNQRCPTENPDYDVEMAYFFNETTGTTMYDYAENGYDLTLTGTFTRDGESYYQTGNNYGTYSKMLHAAGGDWNFTMCVDADSTDSNMFIGFTQGTSAPGSDNIWSSSMSSTALWFTVGTHLTQTTVTSGALYTPGGSVRCVTQDASIDKSRFFQNASFLVEKTNDRVLPSFTMGNFFRYVKNDGNEWDGTMYEFCLFNDVLSDAEITAYYNGELKNPPEPAVAVNCDPDWLEDPINTYKYKETFSGPGAGADAVHYITSNISDAGDPYVHMYLYTPTKDGGDNSQEFMEFAQEMLDPDYGAVGLKTAKDNVFYIKANTYCDYWDPTYGCSARLVVLDSDDYPVTPPGSRSYLQLGPIIPTQVGWTNITYRLEVGANQTIYTYDAYVGGNLLDTDDISAWAHSNVTLGFYTQASWNNYEGIGPRFQTVDVVELLREEYDYTALNDSLTYYWKAEDNVESVTGTTGTFNNYAFVTPDGKIDSAIKYGGNFPNWFDTGIDGALDDSGISVSFWGYADLGSVDSGPFFGQGQGTNPGALQFHVATTGYPYLGIVGANDLQCNFNTVTISPSTWNHYVVIFAGNADHRLYVNGEYVSTCTDSHTGHNALNFGFGKEGDFASTGNGTTDELAIFDRIITSSEVFALYNSNTGTTFTNGMLGAPIASTLLFLDNATWNLTSDGGCINWRTNQSNPCDSSDTTPTLKVDTNLDANCAVSSQDLSYTAMVAGDANRECSTTGAKSHICTIPVDDLLVSGEQYIYVACENLAQTLTTSSGGLAVNVLSTCYYNSVGDFIVAGADNCHLKVTDVGGNNFIIYGPGYAYGLRNVTNWATRERYAGIITYS